MDEFNVMRFKTEVPPALMERIEKDRGVGHRLLMSLLAPTALDKTSPREAAKLLWTIASPTEMLVSSVVKLEPTSDIGVTEIPFGLKFEEGGKYQVEASIEASYTPVARVPDEIWALPDRPAIRNKRVPVPSDKVQDWVTDKLLRNGLEVNDWKTVMPYKYRARKLKLSAVRISASVTVTDQEKANAALVNGIGRAKNFGCGLLQLEKIS